MIEQSLGNKSWESVRPIFEGSMAEEFKKMVSGSVTDFSTYMLDGLKQVYVAAFDTGYARGIADATRRTTEEKN